MRGRVYVFVDAANILYSQQSLRWRVDYKKLKEYFEKECDLKGIYFYTDGWAKTKNKIHLLKNFQN